MPLSLDPASSAAERELIKVDLRLGGGRERDLRHVRPSCGKTERAITSTTPTTWTTVAASHA